MKGFTLLELMLSVAIMAVIVGVGAPIFMRMISSNDLDMAVMTVAQSWRRAQNLALSGDGDTVWGVKVSNGLITLFKGASYATRDTNYDEDFSLPSTITVTGTVTELGFNKLTGTPSATGTVSMSSFADSSTLTINNKGTINY